MKTPKEQIISGILSITILLGLLSACAKPDDESAYSIDSYKENAGLSGQLAVGEQQTDTLQTPGVQENAPPQSEDVTESEPAEDADTDDLPNDAQISEIDTETKENSTDLPYVENVETAFSDTVITEESYDESKLSLPCLRIKTNDGKAITSKTTYKNGTIEIDGTEPQFEMERSGVQIRGRGNSTWARFTKKAYKLKFTINTDLLGMGAGKKWVLLANAMDDTMLRNSLAFDLAKILELEYTTGYRFVNVYLNGEYLGVYQLCEQLEEADKRVNVNSSKTGVVNTGYLLESYGDVTTLKDRTFTIPKIDGNHIHGGEDAHMFVIKSPGPSTVTDNQVNYIRNYVIKANKAIFAGDWETFSETCDVDSFVNMFLVDQIMLNNDMGYSFYLYKKENGKLFLGPPWDYDQSCGDSAHGGSTYKGWYAGTKHPWYLALIKMPEFRALVKARYEEKKPELKAIIPSIDETLKANGYDFAMSNYVYNNFGNEDRWRTIEEIYTMTTYKEHIEYLETWLTNRFVWMEDQFKEW